MVCPLAGASFLSREPGAQSFFQSLWQGAGANIQQLKARNRYSLMILENASTKPVPPSGGPEG